MNSRFDRCGLSVLHARSRRRVKVLMPLQSCTLFSCLFPRFLYRRLSAALLRPLKIRIDFQIVGDARHTGHVTDAVDDGALVEVRPDTAAQDDAAILDFDGDLLEQRSKAAVIFE